MWGDPTIEVLLGKKVTGIWLNEQHLKFATDKGDHAFEVYGDCCSSSYFYDFHGVEKLLKNGPILSVKEIQLDDSDVKPRYQESVAVYGYELTTEDPAFGEVTSVFSFRNDSNGYYGGSLDNGNLDYDWNTVPQLTADCLETEYDGEPYNNAWWKDNENE